MEFSYINDELLSKISTSIFTENDIKVYINDLVTHLNLNEYLAEIKFNFIHQLYLATYDYYTYNLKIDLKGIIDYAEGLYNRDDNEEEKTLFINIMILLTLIHEVVHIKQNSRLLDKFGIYNLIKKELGLIQILTDEEYDEYYIYFTFERDANATSFEAILYLLSTKIKNDALYEYILDNLTKILLSGYKRKGSKLMSPMQVISSRFSKRSFNMVSNRDIYNSLKYGYPVTREEYMDFKSNSKKIILEKNNLHV